MESWVKDCIRTGRQFHFTKVNRWLHNLLNTSCLLLSLSSIVFLLLVALYNPANPLILLLSPILGVLLFSIYILVLHEAAHSMFWIAGNSRLRDTLNIRAGQVMSLLLFQDFQSDWRVGHIRHHQFPLEEGKDPQVAADGICGTALLKQLLLLALIPGVALALNRKKRANGRNKLPILLSVAFWIMIAALLGYFGGILPVLTLFYGFNFLMAINFNRIAQEHGSGLKYEREAILRSRTYRFPLINLIFPYFVNYHFEHHLIMTIPWYLLPKYSRAIAGTVPEHIREHIATTGFRQVGKQLMARRHNLNDTRETAESF
ncbi:MAG: fatty acid desaturase [Spirochaetia bacterium]|nr:fatty acid desaturase [Spirochaetia bacterium]